MPDELLPTFENDFLLTEREPFRLTSGIELPQVTLRYVIYGELNEQRDNAILVFHALTGSARVYEWWADLIGDGKALDTNRFAIVCVNHLGSCYGSTGANSINPVTGERYGATFPIVTTRDVARTQVELLKHLELNKLHAVVGGSVGGMLALQLAIDFPELATRCIVIGASELSAMGLALNHLQRWAIRLEASRDNKGDNVGLARAIAMISYKSAEDFDQKYARRPDRSGEDPFQSMRERFDIAGYLDHQGSVFRNRFDADTYNTLSKAMDLFEIGRGYPSETTALKRIKAETALIGISSDWLFPARDVQALAEKMQAVGVNANYIEMTSPDGHDAFLTDTVRMSEIIKNWLLVVRCSLFVVLVAINSL